MTEEPYQWLEAMGNRRDYVRERIRTGSPVFAVSMADGILLLGVGSGHSKVFELFDRHALAGLGHPADLEKIRQTAIDAAHVEAFTRAPEDVSLRRLVSFGLSAVLKTNFEQLFSAPYLVELLLVELSASSAGDSLVRLHFDGAFQMEAARVVVAASRPELESGAAGWLIAALAGKQNRGDIAELLLEAWWCLTEEKPFGETMPGEPERRAGWREKTAGRVVELGWLSRLEPRRARYESLTLEQLGVAR